ncbi:putative inorganic carbon (HCO3(-)) transporter [Neobacillus niacini]|uniref:O-antigen ligase family protein n=1 Tax=Neobacillus niacini TaxID=86668 RepID=UPI002854553A|nr:O-antigen ligase family protein [Neobacillus niacini]MDR7077905.1 putative inorganic carbon (HCO3(-)) transporter [Neobacillus niacini]
MFWFIILFPILIYPWGFDPYYTTTKTGYLYAFVLATWLYILFKRRYRSLKPDKGDKTIVILLLLFLTLIEISTAFSPNNYTSVYGLIDRKEGLISYFCYFSVFLFSYRLMDKEKLTKVISGVAIVSMIVSLYGILQHYKLDFLPRNSAMRNYGGTYTFFDNPNFFGSYLVLVLLITIPLFLNAALKKYQILYFTSLCLAFVALIFSNTRSGYVGVFFGLVFITLFVVIKRKHLWKRWGALAVSMIVLLFLINMTEQGHYAKRINSVVKESYSVVTNQSTGREGSSRLYIWEKSLPLVKEYFWVGSGPDSFEFVYPNNKKNMEFLSNSIVDKAHNEYLQIAITLGTPALLSYLSFLYLILRRAFQAVKLAEGNEKVLIYGLIATIIGYLVQAFFNISTVPVAPIFWSILGITLAKSTIVINNSHNQNREKYQFENKNQTA